MQIFIKSDKLEAVEVQPSTFIGELESEYTLSFAGKILEDDETIEELGLTDGSTIEATVPLLGGGKKRKKKVYTTPKKIKHKRTKVKMATLKLDYYR